MKLVVAILFTIAKILKYKYATYRVVLKKVIINVMKHFVIIEYYNLKTMETF